MNDTPASAASASLPRNCRGCEHDLPGGSCLALAKKNWKRVLDWCEAQTWTWDERTQRLHPNPAADGCPGREGGEGAQDPGDPRDHLNAERSTP